MLTKFFLGTYLMFGTTSINFVFAQQLPANGIVEAAATQNLYTAIRDLERLTLADIHPQDLITIDSAMLLADVPYRNRFFLLAGWLGRTQALNAVPYEYRRSTRMQNDYDLAMIRAGDPSRIGRLRTLLQTVEVNDDFVFTIAPQLIYTRRREVFDFFFDQILLDDRNCYMADLHGSGQINCAYRLLEMVAPHILNFPLEVGISGDLETDDYPTALETARAWIQLNRADYLINTETY
ncbi:MAG: hypothetical protein AAFZ63_02625 [Bacteroidota bacterium]